MSIILERIIQANTGISHDKAASLASEIEAAFELKRRADNAGLKQFEGYMARLFLACVQVSYTRELSWSADRGDKKSIKVTEVVKDAVLAKDLQKITAIKNGYARVGDLKYWGLLDQRQEWWHQGIYKLTKMGKSFIYRNDTKIPRIIKVVNGFPVDFSEERITLPQALGKQWNTYHDWISEWRMQHVHEMREQLSWV